MKPPPLLRPRWCALERIARAQVRVSGRQRADTQSRKTIPLTWTPPSLGHTSPPTGGAAPVPWTPPPPPPPSPTAAPFEIWSPGGRPRNPTRRGQGRRINVALIPRIPRWCWWVEAYALSVTPRGQSGTVLDPTPAAGGHWVPGRGGGGGGAFRWLTGVWVASDGQVLKNGN